MGKVNMVFEAETAKAVDAFLRIENRQKELERRSKRLNESSKRQGKTQRETFGPQAVAMVKRFAGSLVGAGGLLAAYQLITKELQTHISLQDRAAKSGVTLARARANLIRNLSAGGAKKGEVTETLADINKISSDQNVEEKFVTQAMASALSASGGNREASTKAVRAAARMMSDQPEAIAGMAGTLLDLSKVTGSQDARTNMGLQLFVGGMSRIVDPQQQAKNIPRALINMKSLGMGTRSSAALFSAITTGGGDITGESSGTASISLTAQMRDFFKGKLSGEEGLQRLMSDPRQAKRFLRKASFEKKFQGVIEQLLLNPESSVQKQFKSNLAGFQDNEGLGALADQSFANLSADPLRKVQRVRDIFTAGGGRIRTADPSAGLGGAVRTGLSGALADSGISDVQRRASMADFELRTNAGTNQPVAVAQEILRALIEKLTTPQDYGTDLVTGRALTTVEPTEQSKARADALSGILKELEKLNAKVAPNPPQLNNTPE